MNADTVALRPLDRAVAERALPRLLALDARTPGEPWTAEHWLLSLPEKWRLSRIALAPDGAIVGFLVTSRKGDSVHVHRVAVAEGARRRGLARRLMLDVAAQAASEGYDRITAKTHPSNAAALRFFLDLGFEVANRARDVFLVGQTALIAGLEARAVAEPAPPGSPAADCRQPSAPLALPHQPISRGCACSP